jgi:hypothetical protein
MGSLAVSAAAVIETLPRDAARMLAVEIILAAQAAALTQADQRESPTGPARLSRLLGGWCVTVEDLLAVGASGFGGAVGVEDQLPAVAVDADVVVELAGQDAVVY